MTCIVTGYKTKKGFREALNTNPQVVIVEDPSIVAPWKGNMEDAITRFGEVYVTNHPKRSWFARVTRKNGKIRVE